MKEMIREAGAWQLPLSTDIFKRIASERIGIKLVSNCSFRNLYSTIYPKPTTTKPISHSTNCFHGFVLTQSQFGVRGLAQAVAMTGSDLSSSSKPWKAQYKTSFVVYEEFHEQVK